jgi:hypothetical protein
MAELVSYFYGPCCIVHKNLNQRINNQAARKYRCINTSAYIENPEWVKIQKFGIC